MKRALINANTLQQVLWPLLNDVYEIVQIALGEKSKPLERARHNRRPDEFQP